MSLLPAASNQLPIKELEPFRSGLRPDADRNSSDPADSLFAKMVLEKKQNDQPKKEIADARANGAVKDRPADTDENGRGREAKKKDDSHQGKPAGAEMKAVRTTLSRLNRESDRPSSKTVMELLASLLKVKHESTDSPGKQNKEKIKTDDKKKQILFSLERQVSLSGKESPARTALQAVSQSAANVAVEKSHVRKAVIVDLRDRIEQHGESSKKQANAQVKKTHLEAGVSVAKKASSVKDPFEVTYLSRTAPQVDSPADGRGLRFQEPPAPRNALATRFGEIMKNEMVKHTGVIVKNGGNGEIHLVLKPESLGSVRIRMNIEDNHIVGKIIVDNNTVKAIVEENLSNLENALQEDGYENPAFDVFVAGDQNRGAEEKATFASLLDEEPRPELGGTASYDEERASYYDESLVNIVW